jgi:hypothetical protein
MTHCDAREGKWRGNWRIECVPSTFHTTSEHGVSSITTTDAHTSAVSSRLNWRPRRFKWTRPFRRKTKFGFCACAITFQTRSTFYEYFSSLVFGLPPPRPWYSNMRFYFEFVVEDVKLGQDYNRLPATSLLMTIILLFLHIHCHHQLVRVIELNTQHIIISNVFKLGASIVTKSD